MQSASPTPRPTLIDGSVNGKISTVLSTSKGAVRPGVTGWILPVALATETVTCTPLSTAEYETLNCAELTPRGMTIDVGLRLPLGCVPDVSDAVRLSWVSVLNVAPAGVRVTVSVNLLPAATSTSGTASPPPRVALSVDAAAEMPLGAGAPVPLAGLAAAIVAPTSTAHTSTIRNKRIRTMAADLAMTTPPHSNAVRVRSFAGHSNAVKIARQMCGVDDPPFIRHSFRPGTF